MPLTRRAAIAGAVALAASFPLAAAGAPAFAAAPDPRFPDYLDTPRDMFQWPFSRDSIWNRPIGSEAVYRPLHMTPPAQGYAPDDTYLVFDWWAPRRRLIERADWWPWRDGTQVRGTDTGVQVRCPDAWVLSPPGPRSLPNRMSAMILDRTDADGGALVGEFQYTVRPTPGSDISFQGGLRSVMSLGGDGLTGPNGWGSHGGSGMTGVGGVLRAGDLVGPRPIRHALNFTVNMSKWGTTSGGGYRWPALARDDYRGKATPEYGSYATRETFIQMGSLLALPSTLDIGALGLTEVSVRKIAAALQGFGAYVTDTSDNPGNTWDVHMISADEAALRECPELVYPDGAPSAARRRFCADMDKLMPHLCLIDNNGPDRIGGGGQPIRPLAPDFQGPSTTWRRAGRQRTAV